MSKQWILRLIVLVSMLALSVRIVQAQPGSNKPVKGTGTPGRITKWLEPDVIGDSVVTEVNSNIGIGTTTPGSKLTVAGRIEAFITGISAGVLGQSSAGAGVRGNSDTGAGVYGSSDSGFGTRGMSNSNYGVFGVSLTSSGVLGHSESASGAGVMGSNTNAGGTGVLGQAFLGTGLRGVSSTGFGVFGSSETFTAVEARSNTGFGIFGSSNTNTGIHGQSNGGTGVLGSTGASNRAGVHAVNTGGGTALLAESSSGTGVIGISTTDFGAGVAGHNMSGGENSVGVTGQTLNGLGVFGASTLGAGVLGQSAEGPGLVASSGTGLAGHFLGNVVVSGSISKGGGSFKIDHPLDPANKTLSHSFVESPDMLNIYNGNVTTDANGEATVTLPDYFSALNKDFRYQLTVIGQFAQAIVGSEISENRFVIKTDKPNVKISWQVTGVRYDAWANKNRIPVVEAKPDRERGFYIHPELYDQPDERNVEWARRPELMNRVSTVKQKR